MSRLPRRAATIEVISVVMVVIFFFLADVFYCCRVLVEGIHGSLELIGEDSLSLVVGGGATEKERGGAFRGLCGRHGVSSAGSTGLGVVVASWGVVGCGSGGTQ
jgi:hypothetical protein